MAGCLEEMGGLHYLGFLWGSCVGVSSWVIQSKWLRNMPISTEEMRIQS